MLAVTRLMVDLNATRAELETVRSKILDTEADVLATRAETVSGVRVVKRLYAERDVAQVRQLARLITVRPALVALLGVAAQMLNTQGRGQLSLAQPTPVRADEARVEAAIAKAIKVLCP